MATLSSSRTPPASNNAGGRSTTTAAPPTSTAASHPYTCNTCQVAFRSSELQRGHMHGDWHRYNLKRRVAALPPLASEVFAEKVLTAQESSSEAAVRASFEKLCPACQKTYFSENAFQNHLGSQRHRTRLAALNSGAAGSVATETESIMSSTFSLGEPIGPATPLGQDPEAADEFEKVLNGIQEASLDDGESVASQQARPLESAEDDTPGHHLPQDITASATPSTVDTTASKADIRVMCLFCNYRSPTLALNVSHMGRIHGMFIPEQTYLADLDGLIGFLHEKINDYHECLYCGKLKGTATGVQTHMRDKGHCMIAFDSEAEMIEVGQFYDFRATYSDSEEGGDDEPTEEPSEPLHPAARLGAKREAKLVHTNTADVRVPGDDDGEGWETDSSASSLDSAELMAVPIDHTHQYQKLQKHPHHSHHDPRPHHTADGWHSHAHTHPHAVYHSEYELHLPSGRSAGHRSLARYYRQNLYNYPSPRLQSSRRAISAGAASESDDAGQSPRERGRQVATRANGGSGMLGVTEAKKREIKAVEKRERKRENRERLRYQWGLDKRGNSQKHFRDPLLQ
ncbi:MAG: hypothetical protein M1832_000192 [Thelocarpon impressellum]|nr:MAG: hypothetical protein M1832_000192 [Thelocarpon impressellum]